MGKKLGSLIKSARTDAGLTQEQLAAKVQGASKTDIGRFERGEAEPGAQIVKDIAKACGVTQKSLLDAMPKTSAKTTVRSSSAKPAATKPASSTSSAVSKTSMRVSATEKRLVELYRAADADTRKKALAVLRGNEADSASGALPGVDDVIAGIGGIIGELIQKK